MPGKIHRPGDYVTARYEIIEFIAEGGMQEVYKAADKTLFRNVALKVPKTTSAAKRFKRSAVVSAKVNHPNVAKTLDFLDYNDTNYLIEELIAGRDLGTRIRREFDRLDPHLAAHIIHHVAKGVAASHRVGVFHRDLKPSNIMVSEDAGLTSIKVTDFGIAKMAKAEIEQSIAGGEDSISASATVVGALPYMAPELIQPGLSPSIPADVWAIGAMLYYFLAGQPPFGVGLMAVRTILEGKLPKQEDVISTQQHFIALTTELWSIVADCLQFDPTKRPTAEMLCERFAKMPYSVALRKTGTITKYGSGPGNWGFILGDDGSDCFFHENSYYGKRPVVGARVSFAPFPGRPNPRAFPVLPLKESSVKKPK